MIYGYARISTKKQSIERQIRNITEISPTAKIYAEAFTGTKLTRPEWSKLVKVVKQGDTIIFDSVSRMSRNASDGFKMYEELYTKGVELRFIKEPHIDTATYKKALNVSFKKTGTAVDYILEGISKYQMSLAKEQIKLAFDQAQKEVDDLHKRTAEGIKTAQLRFATEEAEGVQHLKQAVGRPKGVEITTKIERTAKEIILKHSKDFGGTLNDSEVLKLAGCSRNSFYKYKRELKG